MDRHYSADDGDVAADDDVVVVDVIGGPIDPELKNDRLVSDLYDFDSSDCYDSLYVDYDVVLDAVIDGTLDMVFVVVDEAQHPYPQTNVERIQEHPQIVYEQLKKVNCFIDGR